jgi:sugar (pentulose or hexulose) kinase
VSLLGIDVGTAGCKAGAFSVSGELLASACREYAALALRKMGKSASGAIPDLCSALGDIGSAASDAIPALEQVQRFRVNYIAEEAIRKIQGKPPATWH